MLVIVALLLSGTSIPLSATLELWHPADGTFLSFYIRQNEGHRFVGLVVMGSDQGFRAIMMIAMDESGLFPAAPSIGALLSQRLRSL